MFDPIFRMFCFDADKGGGGSPESAPADSNPTGGGDTPGPDSPPTQSPQPPADEIRLTPAQLSERLERARQATLKQFGFDDAEALKKMLLEGKAALDAQKTEAERQAEALKQAQEQAKQLETQANELRMQAEQAALQVEALGLMAGRFANPKAALRLVDLTAVKRGENGEYAGLKEAIDKLAADEPWTLAQPSKKQVAPPIGSTNPEGDGKQVVTDDERRARYFGNFGASGGFFTPRKGNQ